LAVAGFHFIHFLFSRSRRKTEQLDDFSEIGWHLPCSDCRVTDTAPLPLAVVLTSFDPGGTERQMIELVRRLDPARWAVHLACFHRRGAWMARAEESVRSVTVFPVRSFRRPDTLGHMRAFARWCRTERIAVVHTSELYSNIFALPAAASAGVPARIANRREINPDKSWSQIALQRAAYACAGRVVANSQAAAARLAAECVPARKVAIVSNGLDLSEYAMPQPKTRRRTVAMVANLRTEKGHDVLMDAALLVHQHIDDASFLIVGDGSERSRLERRAAALGLGDRFRFLGHREDVPAILQSADIFVLPSRSEAFPNALLEAMAAGLPAVASAVGGMLEMIAHEANGLLVPPGQPKPLAAALERLMTDPVLAGRLGAAARRTVAERYSFERMVAGFERIYLAELARHGVAAGHAFQLAAS
jgi:glycosyltransferase involved in cell wall biosynthesis